MSNRIKKGVCIVLSVICALSALYFGLMFLRTQKEYQAGNEDLQLVKEIRGEMPEHLTDKQKRVMDEASQRAAENDEHKEKIAGYERLKVQNPDMIGWIRIDETPIDYPVMQTLEDPDYYLRRGFDKHYSVYGMIYMDATCQLDGECPNYILYGHHMKNGTMFASLEKYADEDYYKEHSKLEFDTFEEAGEYEILAAFKLPASQMNSEFAYSLAARTEEDYADFIKYCKDHSFYDTGVTAQWPEQLVTMTTCEYTQRDGRFFVVAKKKSSKSFK